MRHASGGGPGSTQSLPSLTPDTCPPPHTQYTLTAARARTPAACTPAARARTPAARTPAAHTHTHTHTRPCCTHTPPRCARRWEKFLALADKLRTPTAVAELFPFAEYFADAPNQPLFAGRSYDADMARARGCFRHLRTMFQVRASPGGPLVLTPLI